MMADLNSTLKLCRGSDLGFRVQRARKMMLGKNMLHQVQAGADVPMLSVRPFQATFSRYVTL